MWLSSHSFTFNRLFVLRLKMLPMLYKDETVNPISPNGSIPIWIELQASLLSDYKYITCNLRTQSTLYFFQSIRLNFKRMDVLVYTQWQSQPDRLFVLWKYFVFTDRQNNQFLRKWMMITLLNLHSMTKMSGGLHYCIHVHGTSFNPPVLF